MPPQPGARTNGPFTATAWNVHGLATAEAGAPLQRNAGAKVQAALGASQADVVALVETWLEDPRALERLPELDGCQLVGVAARRGSQHGRGSGGLALIARGRSLDLQLEAEDTRFGAYVWASVRAPPGCPGPRLYIAAVYLRPENKQLAGSARDASGHGRALARFLGSIDDFAARGPFLIVGDFNAHTGSQPGFVDTRALGPRGLAAQVEDAPPPPRKSKDDAEPDTPGRKLLAACEERALIILNGRTEGDLEGECTFIGNGAGTVVDYAIASSTLWPCVRRLQVDADTAVGHSDHAALHVQLGGARTPPDDEPGPGGARDTGDYPQYLGPRSALASDRVGQAVMLRLMSFQDRYLQEGAEWGTDDLTRLLISTLVNAAVKGGARLMVGPRLPEPGRDAEAQARRRKRWDTEDVQRALQALKAASKHLREVKERAPPGAAAVEAAKAALSRARQLHNAEVRVAREESARREAEERAQAFRRAPATVWACMQERSGTGCPCDPQEQRRHFDRVVNPARHAAGPPADGGARPWPGWRQNSRRRAELEELNAPISEEEVAAALKRLKLRKAADSCGLCAELLRGEERERAVVPALTSFFQRYFDGGFPHCLSEALLIPLYKGKGDKTSMDNYRGIAIIALLSKLYALVLTLRLDRVLEAQGLRSNLQFGFRRGRGTVDAALVLQAAVDATLHGSQGAPPADALYAVYVDFAKAFDSVPREKLWARLHELGVRGKMLAAVQSYYSSVLFRVNSEFGLTDSFSADAGVKQGCPLSPLLFGCFIEAFADGLTVNDTRDAPQLGSGLRLPTVLYADDTTLLARTPKGLQRLLNRLSEFCEASGMAVNEAKTKVMVFRIGAAQLYAGGHRFSYRGQPLEEVSEFRFLGLPLFSNQQNAGRLTAETLALGAAKRYSAMWARAREAGIQDARTILTFFDAIVGSVMSYACPVFAPYQAPYDHAKPDKAEALHLRCLRAVLGAPQWTPKLQILWEFARLPMRFVWLQRTAKYLGKFPKLPEGDALRAALQGSLTTPNGWASRLRHAASTIGPSSPRAPAQLEPVGSSLEAFVEEVKKGIKEASARVMRGLWEQHRQGVTSIGEGRPYIKASFERQRAIIGETLPKGPAPYLRGLATLFDRSFASGLRMLPCMRGMNVRGGADAVEALRVLQCPRCDEANMSYEHALDCEGFGEERRRFGLDDVPELNLVGLLCRGRELTRLCAFMRLVRGLTTGEGRRRNRRWGPDGLPPQDPRPQVPGANEDEVGRPRQQCVGRPRQAIPAQLLEGLRQQQKPAAEGAGAAAGEGGGGGGAEPEAAGNVPAAPGPPRRSQRQAAAGPKTASDSGAAAADAALEEQAAEARGSAVDAAQPRRSARLPRGPPARAEAAAPNPTVEPPERRTRAAAAAAAAAVAGVAATAAPAAAAAAAAAAPAAAAAAAAPAAAAAALQEAAAAVAPKPAANDGGRGAGKGKLKGDQESGPSVKRGPSKAKTAQELQAEKVAADLQCPHLASAVLETMRARDLQGVKRRRWTARENSDFFTAVHRIRAAQSATAPVTASQVWPFLLTAGHTLDQHHVRDKIMSLKTKVRGTDVAWWDAQQLAGGGDRSSPWTAEQNEAFARALREVGGVLDSSGVRNRRCTAPIIQRLMGAHSRPLGSIHGRLDNLRKAARKRAADLDEEDEMSEEESEA